MAFFLSKYAHGGRRGPTPSQPGRPAGWTLDRGERTTKCRYRRARALSSFVLGGHSTRSAFGKLDNNDGRSAALRVFTEFQIELRSLCDELCQRSAFANALAKLGSDEHVYGAS